MSPSFAPPSIWGASHLDCCWDAAKTHDKFESSVLARPQHFGPQLSRLRSPRRCVDNLIYDDYVDGCETQNTANTAKRSLSREYFERYQRISSRSSKGSRPIALDAVVESKSTDLTMDLSDAPCLTVTLRRSPRSFKESSSFPSIKDELAPYFVDKLILSGLTESSMVRLWPEKGNEMLKLSRAENTRNVLKHGSLLVSYALAILLSFRLYMNVTTSSDCGEAVTKLGYRILCIVFEVCLAILVVVSLCWCRIKARMEQVLRISYLYHGCTCIVTLYSVLMFTPPLAITCDDLIKIALCRREQYYFTHIAEVGCGMQGCTAMMASLCIVSLLPHVLPELRHVCVFVIVHGMAWCACTAYSALVFGQLHEWIDCVCGIGLLLCSGAVSVRTKQYMWNKHHKAFKLKYIWKENGKNLFKILECMVPLHVVVPMLRNTGEVIAQQIDIASILFLVIDGFEQWSRHREPREVLDYLNNIFSDLDRICEANDVLKIETVSEEYVAAVGVVPPDPLDSRSSKRQTDHTHLLGCLVKAVLEMFRLQRDKDLDFKMGLNTGPVVAGVIGEKLPRYRLFGDTINTAARMMQKGLVGELQFSEATKKFLPPWVMFTCRGPIEMKGKGVVTTFLLDYKSKEGELNYWSIDSSRVKRVTKHSVPEVNSMNGSPRESPGKRSNRRSTLSSFSLKSDHSAPALGRYMSENTKFATVVKALDVELQRERALDAHYLETQSSCVSSTTNFGLFSRSTRSLGVSAGIPPSPVQGESHKTLKSNATLGSFGPFGGRSSVATLYSSAVDKTQKGCCGLFGFGSKGLSDEELVQFYETFCKSRLVNKDYKVELQIAGLFVLSGLEFLVAVAWMDVLHESHTVFSARRFLSFLVCRGIALLAMGAWWMIVVRGITMSVARAMQIRVVLACILILSFFFSYEALTPKLHDVSNLMDEHEIRRILSAQIYRIRLWPLMFFVMFSIIVFDLRVPPVHTFIVVCFTIIVVGFGSRETALEWDFYMEFGIDQILIFFLIGFLALERSRAEVQGNKGDRKLELAITQTGDRVKKILESLLPPLVVAELQISAPMPCHRYARATIAQSDLVGFTALASTRKPAEVVEIIRDLFDEFDDLADTYGVYKVETVGDAYIAGQAEHTLTSHYRPTDVLLFAIGIIHATQIWSKRAGEQVGCRVGVHTGPCIGGIVGVNMQRYHLFGRLLAIVESLESTSLDGCVHISNACHAVVQDKDEFTHVETDHVTICADFNFEERAVEHLTTSKGEVVEFEAVDGYPTYFASVSKATYGTSVSCGSTAP